MGIRLCLMPTRETKNIFRYARLRGLPFSDTIVMLFTSLFSTLLNTCSRTQSGNICCKATWLSRSKYLLEYRLALIRQYNNNNNEIEWKTYEHNNDLEYINVYLRKGSFILSTSVIIITGNILPLEHIFSTSLPLKMCKSKNQKMLPFCQK